MVQKKVVETMTIEDDHSDEESSGVPISQGNISPIHATIPDTLVVEHQNLPDTEGEEKEVE